MRRREGKGRDIMSINVFVILIFFVIAVSLFFLIKRKNDVRKTKWLVVAFIDLGLSLIGRKTKTENYLLTEKSENIRHSMEKDFLDAIFSQYKDKNTQAILSKHFALFKEACLFSVFHLLLIKKNEKFYNMINSELVSRLSEGLSIIEQKQNFNYINLFLDQFDSFFMKKVEIQDTLPYVFWNVAVEKYPELFSSSDSLGLIRNMFLFDIYESYFTIIQDVLKANKIV
ncbi:MAG: hypothetical protein IJQ99_00705 [Synergistaceae bacterium]|nr:hypothetical protein [Synergistaceae bacterium]